MQRYQRESAKLCEFADAVAAAVQHGGAGQHAAAEALEISRACHLQHAKILEGPLRLSAPWLESLLQETRGAMIGNPVPTASLPSPIARPQPAPVPPQTLDSPLATPAYAQVHFLLFVGNCRARLCVCGTGGKEPRLQRILHGMAGFIAGMHLQQCLSHFSLRHTRRGRLRGFVSGKSGETSSI